MVISEHELDGLRNPSRGMEERRAAAAADAAKAAELQNEAFKVRRPVISPIAVHILMTPANSRQMRCSTAESRSDRRSCVQVYTVRPYVTHLCRCLQPMLGVKDIPSREKAKWIQKAVMHTPRGPKKDLLEKDCSIASGDRSHGE